MITKQEYQTRRQSLAKRLPVDSIALIPANQEVLRNGDAHYPFRQASHFYYLTGFNEPDALLLILGQEGKSILFNRPRHPFEEQWTGRRLGQEDAPTELGIDIAYSIDTLDEKLPELLKNKKTIFTLIGQFEVWNKRIIKAWQVLQTQSRRGIAAAENFCDLNPLLGEMRLFKSDSEVACLRRAAEVSVAAHEQAMRACRYAKNEYELEAAFLYELNRQGCRHVAYEPIVAGGSHACVLHYTANNQPLNSGELVLMDAGGEFNYYAADITRVFPISGQFSPEQRSLYNLVLTAQRAGIACIKPGVQWNEIQQVMVVILTEGLVDLGILRGDVQQLIQTEGYKPFYMHSSGHWLGLDVHDCGRYKIDGEWRKLEPGMVLTVEPGLYIAPGMADVDPKWWGIGIRIEDDILVTTNGNENLTASLPVEPDEIEACMRG